MRAVAVAASPTTNMNIAIVKIGSRTERESANNRHRLVCTSGQFQNALVQLFLQVLVLRFSEARMEENIKL